MIRTDTRTDGGRAGLATFACFVVFFLATADQVFAVRAFGVNLRFANLLLGAGLVVWLSTRRAGAKRDLVALGIAWLPFAAVYGAAAIASDEPRLTLLKLAWFAFNMLTAFAWCRLFAVRDLVRGYFAAFLLVSGMLAVDFMSGFARGSAYMIGFAQPNDLIAGHILHRPHAFYYEPSYAASAVAVAWALALTPMGRAASMLSTMLIGAGLAALVVTMSRIGWLYAILAGLARLLVPGAGTASGSALPWWRIGAALGFTMLVCAVLLAPDANRERFAALVKSLGWQQTFQRVCPIVQSLVTMLELECLDESERRLSAGRARDIVPEQTSEGQRLVSMGESIESVIEHPWLGQGVTRGRDRLIEPVTSNVWVEIAVEGGILAAVSFAWGLAFSLHRWRAFAPGYRLIGIVLALYFLVAWQFLQTFPRLDPWLAFWVALTFTASQSRACPAPDRARDA